MIKATTRSDCGFRVFRVRLLQSRMRLALRLRLGRASGACFSQL